MKRRIEVQLREREVILKTHFEIFSLSPSIVNNCFRCFESARDNLLISKDICTGNEWLLDKHKDRNLPFFWSLRLHLRLLYNKLK